MTDITEIVGAGDRFTKHTVHGNGVEYRIVDKYGELPSLIFLTEDMRDIVLEWLSELKMYIEMTDPIDKLNSIRVILDLAINEASMREDQACHDHHYALQLRSQMRRETLEELRDQLQEEKLIHK